MAEACGADGVLWWANGDALVRSYLVSGTAARGWLNDQARHLVSTLCEAPAAAVLPDPPDVDVDENTRFDPLSTVPVSRRVFPVIHEGVCRGGFLVFFFIEQDLEKLEEVLAAAVEAFDVAFLLRRLRHRVDASSDRLKEIAEVGRIFAEAGEPERTMSRILDLAVRSSGAEIGAIVNIGENGAPSATGMQIETLQSIRFRNGETLIERAMAVKEESIYDLKRLCAELGRAEAMTIVQSIAVFPLFYESRSHGALLLLNIPEVLLVDEPLIAMLSTIARLAAAAITSEERQRERLEEEKTRQELRAARIIQQSLIPRSLPAVKGITMAGLWKPSLALGGDFYDIFLLSPSRLGVVIADVSGKGLAAALLMAVTRSYLRVLADRPDMTPGQVLAGVNERLSREIADNRFVTANYVVIDRERGECVLANAGHHAPVLVDASGAVHMMQADGLPLGIFADTTYDEAHFSIAPGSSLVFYTDGLLETRNSSGDMLGRQGLEGVLKEHRGDTPSKLLDHLWDTTVAFADRHEPNDDWTAVVVNFDKS